MKTGYIYKIWSVSNPEMVYYGSTQQQVCKRMNDHRRGYDTWKNPNKNKNFTSSYLIFDMGEYEYATLESIEFEELFELRNRERFYIENNTCVNCRVPNRTKKEWREANKEKYDVYMKKYKEENREKIKDQKKKYREENREKVVASEKKYREENKEKLKDRRKIYDEATREKIAAYRKKHREENKEKIAAYRKKYQEENRENLNAKAKIYREKKRQEKLLKLT
mgnify:CR=1 FL=1